MENKLIHSDDINTVIRVGVNAYRVFRNDKEGKELAVIRFQDGNPKTNGINGLSMEANLAVMISRLETLNQGQFKSINNDLALGGMKAALAALEDRIYERKQRNVHNTLKG